MHIGTQAYLLSVCGVLWVTDLKRHLASLLARPPPTQEGDRGSETHSEAGEQGAITYVTFTVLMWSEVTYDQVWWPIFGICALRLTNPKRARVQTHTHTPDQESNSQPLGY